MTEQTTRTGTSRRDFLRRSAIVGGTLVWAAPTVQAFAPRALANYSNLEVVGTASAAGTSVTIPAHIAGDLIMIAAGRSHNTAPGLGSGFTLINQGNTGESGGGAASLTVGYRVATASGTSSGTWSNADNIVCWVLRGQLANGSPIGASSALTGTDNAPTLPGLSLNNTSGSSWVLGAVHHAETGGSFGGFSNMERRESVVKGNGKDHTVSDDTNGGVSGFASRAAATGENAGWRAVSIEILSS